MASLGKYELVRQLGSGSMGTVYLARDTVLERDIALKTIRTGVTTDAEVRERFYREAKTCARLQHPSIVSVYDLGEHEGFAYIAMELLTGDDFRKVIDQRADHPIALKLELMIQICEALAHAHRHGIVHRDVKPSNLFLCSDQRAKVLDFGIARLPSSQLTIAGRVLGTPNYMAPEQILGRKSDGRADLFSAAIVFFEFLVNRHPFQAPLVPRRIVDDAPDSIFDHDSSVPLPFERIFAKALQKDPELRYATGDEMAADIRAVLDAVRLDSSPTFSRVSLPSARTITTDSAGKMPVFNAAAGVDSTDASTLSEFLRLLSEFDHAIDTKAVPEARALLDRLRVIESADPRFSDSMRQCEAKLASLSPMPAETVLYKPSQDPECPACGTTNRGGATFCVGCGANVNGAVTIPPKHPESRIASDVRAYGSKARDVLTANKNYVSAALSQPRIKVLASVAAITLLVLAGTLVFPREPVLRPFVATGAILTANARLFAAPSAASKTLESLPIGAPVHILAEPRTKEPGWLNVQWIDAGKPKATGYLRSYDISNIDSTDVRVLFGLARAAVSNEQLAIYNKIIEKFPNDPYAKRAQVEAGKIYLGMATKGFSAGDTDWRKYADAAKEAAEKAGSEKGAAELLADANKLLAPPVLSTDPPALSPEDILANDLRTARYHQGRGEYDLALKVLSRHADNKEALILKGQVTDAKKFENDTAP